MDVVTGLRRGYLDGRFGQMHVVEAGGVHRGAAPTLLCLHATAYSSRSLERLVARLGEARHVIALDTPGYGGSDGPPGPVTVDDYAGALLDAVHSLGLEQAVDIFGYHTGATIAFAAAAAAPDSIRRIAAIGIPYFTGAAHPEWRRRLVVRHQLGADLGQFDERWRYLVEQRPQGMTLQAGFANFVDELRAWPNGWWAHEALFNCDLGAILPELRQDVLVINTESPLAPMSRAAAALIPGAAVHERPDISGAIFECHVAALAEEIESFLDGWPGDAEARSREHGIRQKAGR